MGDRANFGFTQSNGDTIVVYGHWAGSGMLDLLARAVDKARPRWDQESYATRIAISNLIQDEWRSETGWGMLVNERSDNEHKIPIINFEANTFSLHEEAPFSDNNKIKGVSDEPIFTQTLDAFVSKYAQELILAD
jgi:hypothetical protein